MVSQKPPKVNREEVLGAYLLSLSEKTKQDSRQIAEVVKVLAKFAKDSWGRIDAFLKETDRKIEKRLAELKDGYTPQKGKDYTDGKDGYTPVKGKDYFDGEDGEDGKDADPKDVVPLVLKELPTKEQLIEEVTKNPEAIRNALELLRGKDRLNVSAIDGLDELLKQNTTVARTGGGTSAMGVAQAFKYIAKTEQPTGAINGSNVTYVVKANIWWIAGFTLNGEQIAELPNFTYSGRTITFATALPADYSGKDFEIKYIGS